MPENLADPAGVADEIGGKRAQAVHGQLDVTFGGQLPLGPDCLPNDVGKPERDVLDRQLPSLELCHVEQIVEDVEDLIGGVFDAGQIATVFGFERVRQHETGGAGDLVERRTERVPEPSEDLSARGRRTSIRLRHIPCRCRRHLIPSIAAHVLVPPGSADRTWG